MCVYVCVFLCVCTLAYDSRFKEISAFRAASLW